MEPLLALGNEDAVSNGRPEYIHHDPRFGEFDDLMDHLRVGNVENRPERPAPFPIHLPPVLLNKLRPILALYFTAYPSLPQQPVHG